MASSPRTAIVTGASSGIGMATARALAADGATVYALARRVERMAELRADGIRPLSVDVTDDPSMTSAVDRIVEETGRLDVLVNNAGYGSYGAVEDVPISEARRQFEVNVFGLGRMIQLAVPQLRRQGAGTIVNISSMGGKIYTPFGGWYHATKFAVEGLSDALRLELAPFGVRVVVIEPGAIDTEWGGIAADSLVQRSGSGAYADRAVPLAQVFAASEAGPVRASRPELVARTIVRAVNSRHPRPRYAIGIGAKPSTYARRLLPDVVFDKGVSFAVDQLARRARRSGPVHAPGPSTAPDQHQAETQ